MDYYLLSAREVASRFVPHCSGLVMARQDTDLDVEKQNRLQQVDLLCVVHAHGRVHTSARGASWTNHSSDLAKSGGWITSAGARFGKHLRMHRVAWA